MAGPWTVSRDRQDGEGGADLRAALGRIGARAGARPGRTPFARQAWHRVGSAAVDLRPGSSRAASGPSATTHRPPSSSADRPPTATANGSPAGRAGRSATSAGRPAGARIPARAVPLLAVLTAAGVVLAWAVVHVAERGVAASQAAAKMIGGPLVIPAPRLAGGFPRRFGAISDPAAQAIVTEFRQRFGAVGGGLVADAGRSAGAGQPASQGASGNGAPERTITASWTSALYGEPGHLDPDTYRPSWVMYLGLTATSTLGPPSATIVRLMTGLLGPYAVVGPWRVAPGHRGGSANCTVAWLGQTSVSVCGWANSRTIGALMSPVRDTSVRELATLMIKMRYDLQRS